MAACHSRCLGTPPCLNAQVARHTARRMYSARRPATASAGKTHPATSLRSWSRGCRAIPPSVRMPVSGGREQRVRSGPGRSLGLVPDLPRVPRAREAVIPTNKLVGYALNPKHPRGRHKARVFASALGIRQADWRYLREQLLNGIVDAPVRGTRITPFGVLYDVVVLVDGLNGATTPVVTIWLVEADRPPRLVSTWPDIP